MSWSVYCGGGTGDCLPQDGRPSVSLITTAQDDEEGTSERLVQEGIEEGVQPWIDVAQPQESCPQLPRHRIVYERVHYVCDKEGGPAQAEAPHDDAQGLGSFGLGLHAMRAVLVRLVPAVSRGPCALQHPDLPGVLPGGDVDAIIGQHHQQEGKVEGHHRAGNGIWLVDHEYAVRGVGSLVELPLLNQINDANAIPALHDREERNKCRDYPAASKHYSNTQWSHLVPVHQWLATDSVVPVQWYAAQVQDRCCGEQDIEGCSDEAEHLPIDPVVLDQLNGSKRHHQYWHQQVREGKRNDEIIGLDFPELPVPAHSHHHQQVPQDGHQDNCRDEGEQYDLLCYAEALTRTHINIKLFHHRQ